MVKVSRVIEAKNVSHVYMGWSNELKLTVEGGQLNVELDESSLRAIAKVVNSKIAEQDKEKAEAAVEAAAALAEGENDE
jgi:hypothetical protein|tara:strand:+ start:239 stop:475 length:237 start_codon:yes stop_codon:yes gene_type:complete